MESNRSIVQKIRKLFFTVQSILMTRALRNLLNELHIVLVDVGAAGGIEPRWKKISPLLYYIGFEPDSKATTEERQTKFAEHTLFSVALGAKKSKQKFYISKGIGKSSIYRPNYSFLKNFADVGRFQIENEIELYVDSIDQVIAQKIDFIKLDTQGSELSILTGSKNSLISVFGVEVEVEFLEIYSNQPLLSSVHKLLSESGFEFIDFINLSRWERNIYSGLGQLVHADALFLKTPETISNNNLCMADLKKYLAILFLYNRFDLLEKMFLVYPNLKNEVKHFYKFQNRKRKKQRKINYFIRLVNAALSNFGVELKTHLLY